MLRVEVDRMAKQDTVFTWFEVGGIEERAVELVGSS